MHRVRMLIHFGITPYIIFDGDNLPSKAGTEQDRRDRRKEGKRLGLELLKVGKTAQAQQELQKAVDVTAEMARMFIEELKANNIQYVVAPYEADSQMVYLERKGVIDGILSEDSDLLVFGAKRLITKLDKYGECVEINRSNFTACKEVSLVGWSDAEDGDPERLRLPAWHWWTWSEDGSPHASKTQNSRTSCQSCAVRRKAQGTHWIHDGFRPGRENILVSVGLLPTRKTAGTPDPTRGRGERHRYALPG
jgi:hypothetical protein